MSDYLAESYDKALAEIESLRAELDALKEQLDYYRKYAAPKPGEE